MSYRETLGVGAAGRQSGEDLMQFSLIFEAQLADPSAENERQTLNDCVEQAVEAERVSFDRIWAVEHHHCVGMRI